MQRNSLQCLFSLRISSVCRHKKKVRPYQPTVRKNLTFLSAEPKLITLRQDAKTLGEEAGKQLLTMIGMCKLETAEARSGLLPFLRCLFVEMPVELLCQILTVNQTGLFGDMCSVYEILLVIFSGQLPCVNHVDAEELFFGCDRFDQL